MTTGGNEWQGQLNVVLSIPGVGAGAAMPGRGGGQLSSPAINDMANHLRRISGDTARQGTVMDRSLAKVGIKFNLAAILKQSQIFTSTLGSLFQIFGAVADIILAAFMPILVPAIRWVASQLPEIKVVVEKLIGRLVNLLIDVRNFAGDLVDYAKIGGRNFLESLGMSGDSAEKIINLQKEAAVAIGSTGMLAAGAWGTRGRRNVPGADKIKGWGGKGMLGLGIWEAGEAVLDPGWASVSEGILGVGGGVAALKGKIGKAAIMTIGSQLIEFFADFFGDDDGNKIKEPQVNNFNVDGKTVYSSMTSDQEELGLVTG